MKLQGATFFVSDPARSARGNADPVETMRACAVLLLVAYHVIGSGPGSGMEVDYPHPLRMLADFLIDLRMPFFAFIAGYVYALRPLRPGQYRSFIAGKFQRLYIPGAVAMLVFGLVATLIGNGFALEADTFWQIFVFPYAHYWFLQAILVIFVVWGLVEALTGGRGTAVFLVLACAGTFYMPFIPGNFMSVNAAVYLLPYFLLGVFFVRYARAFHGMRWLFVAVTLVLVAWAVRENILTLQETGAFSKHRLDPQSLIMGMSVCLLAILALPHVPQLERLGPYSYTIYLYHVLGTAGMREFLKVLGITAEAPVFVLGIVAGILGPVALHVLAGRTPVTRFLLLGQKRRG